VRGLDGLATEELRSPVLKLHETVRTQKKRIVELEALNSPD